MYTHPDYRRKGIAYKTLDKLICDTKCRGITSISLEATAMGRPLYEKYGFVKMNDESILVLGGKEGNDVPYSESYIYQIDKSGNIIASFDIYDLFSNIDLEFAESLRGTDMVVNSAYYQEDNHELILSLRGINSILSLNYETKKINWIFGDSNFYSSKFSS